MSGNIRRAMGPALGRLRRRVAASRASLEEAAAMEDNDDYEQIHAVLVAERLQLLQVLVRLRPATQRWEELIDTLEGEARDAENAIFDGFVQEGRHFLEWLEEADEVIGLITAEVGDGDDQPIPVPEGAVAQQVPPAANPPHGHAAAPQPRVKLPQLTLPTFDGNPLEWPSFWQSFESAVDRHELEPIDKLNYLNGCLKGKAAKAIAGYRGGENYPLAVATLRRLFGDPVVITDALQAELFNLPIAIDTVESLQLLSETVERTCLQLVALGRPDDDPMICQIIKSKLPRTARMAILSKEQESERRWVVTDLRHALAKLVALQQEDRRCDRFNQQQGRDDTRPHNRQERRRDKNAEQARVFAAVTQESNRTTNRGRQPECLFCQGSHWSSDCMRVTEVAARKRMIFDQERCLNCLRRGHKVAECKNKKGCFKCGDRHHQAVCPKDGGKSSNKGAQRNGGDKRRRDATGATGTATKRAVAAVTVAAALAAPEEVETIAAVTAAPGAVTLMATHVRIFAQDGEDNRQSVLFFFDGGAQVNLIKKSVVQRLGLRKLREAWLNLLPFHGKLPLRMNAPLISFGVELRDGETRTLMAYQTDFIVKSVRRAELNSDRVIAQDEEPDVLIGLTDFWDFFKAKEQISNHLFRIQTLVGPVVCGRDEVPGIDTDEPISVLALPGEMQAAEPMLDDVKRFWDLQLLGIKDDPRENDDETAMAHFNTSVRRQSDGRYSAGWPWKDYPPELPSNFNMSYLRLGSLLRKLQAQPELLEKYGQTIKEQLDAGLIEPASRSGHTEHFLPHHHVVTHKLRVVFDASAHPKGEQSLNDAMFRGPVIMPDLAGLLMRFRLGKYALWADLEKAFNAISLDERDREFCKFLWARDVQKPLTAQNMVVYSRVAEPECRPEMSFAMAGIFAFGTLLSACWLIAMSRQIVANVAWMAQLFLSIPLRFCRWLVRCAAVQPQRSSPDSECSTSGRRRYLGRTRRFSRLDQMDIPLMAVLLALLAVGTASGSADVVSITASADNCWRTANGTECQMYSSSMIALLPAGQTVRMLLRGPHIR